MDPREMGRRAALMHMKLAAAPATTGTSSGAPVGGAPSATTAGAKPPAATAPAPAPVSAPAARPGAVSTPPAPAPAAPTGAGGAAGAGSFAGGLGALAGGLSTPQGLGQMLGQFSQFTKPMLDIGGFPLLAAGSNLALGGGRELGNLTRGPIGGGAKPSTSAPAPTGTPVPAGAPA